MNARKTCMWFRRHHRHALMTRETFRGAIPADRLYDIHHDMWVMGDGALRDRRRHRLRPLPRRPIIAFTAKPSGAEVSAGRGLGTVESSKTVVAVHAPLSFVLDETERVGRAPAATGERRSLRRWLDGARAAAGLGRGKSGARRCRRLCGPRARHGPRRGRASAHDAEARHPALVDDADRPTFAPRPSCMPRAAAALDCEVEIHFAGPAVTLLIDGVAADAVTSGGKTVYCLHARSGKPRRPLPRLRDGLRPARHGGQGDDPGNFRRSRRRRLRRPNYLP